MKADQHGFLIADTAIDVGDLTHGIQNVRADTSAILSLLKQGHRASVLERQKVRNAGPSTPIGRNKPVAPSSTPLTRSVAHRTRNALGQFEKEPSPGLSSLTRAVDSMTRKETARKRAEDRAKTSAESSGKDQKRDSNGRFGSDSRVGPSGGGSGRKDGGARDADGGGFLSRFKGLFTKIGSHGLGTGDFDKVDPSIEAAKEVSRLVGGPLSAAGSVGRAVIGRGFSGSGKSPSIPWYRRILQELHLTRKATGDFALTQTRVLKDIDRKTGGVAAGGAAKGPIGSLISSVAGGASSIGGSMLGALGKGGAGLLGMGKFALKRLPLLGALFAGGSALASVFGGDDPDKTPEENRTAKFTGAGSGIGALIGGGIGMLGGPVGAMIGGVIGDKVGELVGAWLATVDWKAVGASISSAWDTTVSTMSDAWKSVTDKLDGIGKTVSEAWKSIVAGAKAFLKDKFGIDVDAITEHATAVVAPLVDKAAAVAAPVVAAVKQGATATVDYAKDRVEKMAAPITNAASNLVDYGQGLLGGGSKANKAAIMRQAATITDPHERAMFLAQTDHESGGFRKVEEDLNYKPKSFLANFGARAGLKTEADAAALLAKGKDAQTEAMYGGAWGAKNLGNTAPGDAGKYIGRGDIQLTGKANYAAAGAALGLDLVGHPELMKDPDVAARASLWYWNSRKGLSDAGKAGDVRGATQAVNGGTNGLSQRSSLYNGYLTSMGEGKTGVPVPNPALASPTVAVAAAAVPQSPRMPSVSVPAPAIAPPSPIAAIPQKLNSDPPQEVRVSVDEAVGQDLRDRRLAQIATGGVAP